MRFFISTLQSVFDSIHQSTQTVSKVPPLLPAHAQLSLQVLLQLVFTLGYVKTSLIEEPLAKYTFIKKDKELKTLYATITDTVKEYTQCYLERNKKSILASLKKSYEIDWVSYKVLQPVCRDDVMCVGLMACRCEVMPRSS